MATDETRWTVNGNKALASALGVTTRTITNFRNDGLPRDDDGSFDVEVCRDWSRRRLARAQSRSRRGLKKSDPDDEVADDLGEMTRSKLDDEKVKVEIRLKRLQEQSAELGLRLEKGDLLEKAEVDKHQGQMFTSLRRRFMAMGRRLGPDCAGQDARVIQTKIEAEVAGILTDFAIEKEQD